MLDDPLYTTQTCARTTWCLVLYVIQNNTDVNELGTQGHLVWLRPSEQTLTLTCQFFESLQHL